MNDVECGCVINREMDEKVLAQKLVNRNHCKIENELK